MSGDIWVFAETKNEELSELSLEVLSEACRLARTNDVSVEAVLMGHWTAVAKTVSDLFNYGADKVFVANHRALAVSAAELCSTILAGLTKEYTPSVLLFGASPFSTDLAVRVAASVKTSLLANADRLQISENGLMLATRLCYERKVHTTVVCPNIRPQIATIEPGVIKIRKLNRTVEGKPEVVSVNVDKFISAYRPRVKFIRYIKADPKKMDIAEAPLIVAGGKGVGNRQQFAIIEQLADLIGAAVAGSRVAVDLECIERDRQIGQSGKTVSPELLISCGISGANAHTIGMKDAKTVIAINMDKNAPIIKMADLGVVGDLHEIIPILNNLLKNDQKKYKLEHQP